MRDWAFFCIVNSQRSLRRVLFSLSLMYAKNRNQNWNKERWFIINLSDLMQQLKPILYKKHDVIDIGLVLIHVIDWWRRVLCRMSHSTLLWLCNSISWLAESMIYSLLNLLTFFHLITERLDFALLPRDSPWSLPLFLNPAKISSMKTMQ